jgi:predicted NodU family carbamoyl transferase
MTERFLTIAVEKDGIGEAACSTLARGEGARIETIETFSFPHSLAFVWEHASIHLGFSPYDASKVMGLAAYGDPDVYRRQLASIIQVSEIGEISWLIAAFVRSRYRGRGVRFTGRLCFAFKLI